MQKETISEARIEQDLRVLTQDIGVRLAGTEGERRAAEYIAEQGRQLGARARVTPPPPRVAADQLWR